MTASPAPTAPFAWPVRVYWEDTDAGGVVFYANYLKYFERARTEWLRALGVGQQALAERTGAIFVVADVQLRYLLPARLDDVLSITVQVRDIQRAALLLSQQALRADGSLLCEAQVRVACVDRERFRPRRFPEELAKRLLEDHPAPV